MQNHRTSIPPGSTLAALTCAALLTGLFAGCASPGIPLPPSLKLPDVVTTLTATRVGNHVDLQWTTPTRTTDGKPIVGAITAEICRDAYPNPLAAPGRPVPAPKATAASAPASATATPPSPCAPLIHLTVTPGPSQAVDTLPPALTSGDPGLIGYRIQLRNAAGRTAGPSFPAFTASGAAPAPVESFRGTSTKAGALLEWTAAPAPQSQIAQFAIELDRVVLTAPPTAKAPRPKPTNPAQPGAASGANPGPKPGVKPATNPLAAFATPPVPTEQHFRAGDTIPATSDPGGTLDRTAEIGGAYRYSAQRVRTVILGAYTVELRSAASPAVTVAMLDVFPPGAPTGLIAVPGFTEGAGPQSQRPTIDLSWQPNPDARVAGYRIYRRDLAGDTPQGDWRRLNDTPVPAPGFRDLTVQSGHRYQYRVTALDSTGNESSPSDTAAETAP